MQAAIFSHTSLEFFYKMSILQLPIEVEIIAEAMKDLRGGK